MTVTIPIHAIELTPGSTISIHNLSWQDFQQIVTELGEQGNTHMAYYQGTLEIKSLLALHQANNELEARIAERTAQLREANDRLRQSEERLSLAIEGAGMATWDVDLQTGKALWSVQHFRLMGYEPTSSGEATMEMWRFLKLLRRNRTRVMMGRLPCRVKLRFSST